MFDFIYQIFRTARPRQWLKNLALIAPALILDNILDFQILVNLFDGFIAFCLMSSGAYFINDIIDAQKDRLHPIKKNRPIASGKIPTLTAWLISLSFIGTSIIYSSEFCGNFFTIILIVYILIQLLYSTFLRSIIILDSLTVASGFVLRVIAGGIISEIAISSWLILTTIALSLLLAFGKRRSEKTLLSEKNVTSETRATLKNYPDNLLDAMITMSATFCIVTYSFFTFQVSPELSISRFRGLLPASIDSPKWLMITIPIVIYGVARYLYVIYEKKEGESPERVLLSDKPLFFTVGVWVAIIFFVNNFL